MEHPCISVAMLLVLMDVDQHCQGSSGPGLSIFDVRCVACVDVCVSTCVCMCVKLEVFCFLVPVGLANGLKERKLF